MCKLKRIDLSEIPDHTFLHLVTSYQLSHHDGHLDKNDAINLLDACLTDYPDESQCQVYLRVAPNSEFDRISNIFAHEKFPNAEHRIVFVHEKFLNTE